MGGRTLWLLACGLTGDHHPPTDISPDWSDASMCHFKFIGDVADLRTGTINISKYEIFFPLESVLLCAYIITIIIQVKYIIIIIGTCLRIVSYSSHAAMPGAKNNMHKRSFSLVVVSDQPVLIRQISMICHSLLHLIQTHKVYIC